MKNLLFSLILFGFAAFSNAQTKSNWQQAVDYTIQVTLDDELVRKYLRGEIPLKK